MATDEITRGLARANQDLLARLMHGVVETGVMPRDWIIHMLQDAENAFLLAGAQGTDIDIMSGQSINETRKLFVKLNPGF